VLERGTLAAFRADEPGVPADATLGPAAPRT